MYYTYAQSRSDHRRGFTGTLLRAEIRSRGGHDNRTLTRLIDLGEASQRLGISPLTLEELVQHTMIPHYNIAGQIRFQVHDLDEWVRLHKLEEIATCTPEDNCFDWEEEL